MGTTSGNMTTGGGDPVDGRTLRRARNRSAVIAALLDIVREGDLRPAASEIAERAGVSHRSIFRYFDDLDDLVRTAIDEAFARAHHLAEITDIGVGALDERIDRLVRGRLALFVEVDGAMQVARMRAPSIPAIDEGIAEIALLFREQIAEHFATELDRLGEEERSHLVDAILVLTSYDSFAIHRRLLHRDLDRVHSAWVGGVGALLA